MPPIHENRNKLWSFIRISKEQISLKDIIDNLQNYAVATGIYFIGETLSNQQEIGMIISGYIFEFISFILGILIILQTWELLQRLSYTMWDMDIVKIYQNTFKSSIFIYFLLLIPITIMTTLYYLVKYLSKVTNNL